MIYGVNGLNAHQFQHIQQQKQVELAENIQNELAVQSEQGGFFAQQPQQALLTGGQSLVSKNRETNQVLLQLQEQQQDEQDDKADIIQTSKGDMHIDEYFAKEKTYTDIRDVPLPSPSMHNVRAFARHAAGELNDLMQQYNIPEGPKSFSFNQDGEVILPEDYEHAEEFKQMLDDNEKLHGNLTNLQAWTSHALELQRIAQEENDADLEDIILQALMSKDKSREYNDIEFSFTDGNFVVKGNGVEIA